MSVKTITITEDAYTRLAARKNPGESFSEVVCRITGGHSILELAGILSDKEADTVQAWIKQSRKQTEEKLRILAKKLA